MFALFGGAVSVPCPQKWCLCSHNNLFSASLRLFLLVGFFGDSVYLCEPFLMSVKSKHTVKKILSGNEECCKMLAQMNSTLKKKKTEV